MSDYSLVEKIKSLQGKFDSLSAQIADPDVMSDMKRYVQLTIERTMSALRKRNNL